MRGREVFQVKEVSPNTTELALILLVNLVEARNAMAFIITTQHINLHNYTVQCTIIHLTSTISEQVIDIPHDTIYLLLLL